MKAEALEAELFQQDLQMRSRQSSTRLKDLSTPALLSLGRDEVEGQVQLVSL